jgi:hypothetical protein
MKIVELAPDDLDQISFLDAVAIVDRPAIETNFRTFNQEILEEDFILESIIRLEMEELTGVPLPKEFYFSDEKQMIIGPLMIPGKLIDRIDDTTGELYQVFFTAESIRLLKDRLMKEEKINKLNFMHDPNRPVEGFLSETWIVEDSDKDKSALYGFKETPGTWMGMYFIPNRETFLYIKQNFSGFSVEGSFTEKVVSNT